jgi:hypothetical protein
VVIAVESARDVQDQQPATPPSGGAHRAGQQRHGSRDRVRSTPQTEHCAPHRRSTRGCSCAWQHGFPSLRRVRPHHPQVPPARQRPPASHARSLRRKLEDQHHVVGRQQRCTATPDSAKRTGEAPAHDSRYTRVRARTTHRTRPAPSARARVGVRSQRQARRETAACSEARTCGSASRLLTPSGAPDTQAGADEYRQQPAAATRSPTMVWSSGSPRFNRPSIRAGARLTGPRASGAQRQGGQQAPDQQRAPRRTDAPAAARNSRYGRGRPADRRELAAGEPSPRAAPAPPGTVRADFGHALVFTAGFRMPGSRNGGDRLAAGRSGHESPATIQAMTSDRFGLSLV